MQQIMLGRIYLIQYKKNKSKEEEYFIGINLRQKGPHMLFCDVEGCERSIDLTKGQIQYKEYPYIPALTDALTRVYAVQEKTKHITTPMCTNYCKTEAKRDVQRIYNALCTRMKRKIQPQVWEQLKQLKQTPVQIVIQKKKNRVYTSYIDLQAIDGIQKQVVFMCPLSLKIRDCEFVIQQDGRYVVDTQSNTYTLLMLACYINALDRMYGIKVLKTEAYLQCDSNADVVVYWQKQLIQI